MKKVFVILLLASVAIYAQDPFEKANELYNNSQFREAKKEFKCVYEAIQNGKIKEEDVEKDALIRGHVNYADVLWAAGISDYNENKYEKAKKEWLKACDHWSYRLEGGQFGRTPLNDEWDGSDPTGKTIVVLSERDRGAFGDTFIMSFLMRYLKNKGANVHFVPQKPLQKVYETKKTKQSDYVDTVSVRGNVLPKHDAKIYLWSLLKNYIEKNPRPFPVKNWLSGPDLDEFKDILEKHAGTLLVGFWYRGSGNVSQAADYRSLDRDPGAHRMVTALQNIPNVTLICLEGMGHRPINENDFDKKERTRMLGNLDALDKTSHDTSRIVIFPGNFDRNRGAFVDTFAVMHYIKQQKGLLIGSDTGLLMAAAGMEKPKNYKESSVLAVINEHPDFRWGEKKEIQKNGLIKPRKWYLANDVTIYQAPRQGNWEAPLTQVRTEVEKRAEKYQEMMQKK